VNVQQMLVEHLSTTAISIHLLLLVSAKLPRRSRSLMRAIRVSHRWATQGWATRRGESNRTQPLDDASIGDIAVGRSRCFDNWTAICGAIASRALQGLGLRLNWGGLDLCFLTSRYTKCRSSFAKQLSECFLWILEVQLGRPAYEVVDSTWLCGTIARWRCKETRGLKKSSTSFSRRTSHLRFLRRYVHH